MAMVYDRILSNAFENILGINGSLNGLVANPGQVIEVKQRKKLPLDVQLRPNNEVHFYAGLTKVLTLRWKDGLCQLVAKAHPTYRTRYDKIRKSQIPVLPDIFGEYPPEPMNQFSSRYRHYIDTIGTTGIDSRWLAREGFWQAWLSHRYGHGYSKGDPFIIIDAQAVIGFGSRAEKDQVSIPIKNRYTGMLKITMASLQGIAPRLAQSTAISKKGFGDELDLLGVTPDGDLALIEVKSGHDAKGVYLSPFQLGAYKDLWNAMALQGKKQLRDSVNRLIEQKIRIGLLPTTMPKIILREDFDIIPVLAVGDPNWNSDAWRRLDHIWNKPLSILWFMPRIMNGGQLLSPGQSSTIGSGWKWI